MQTSYLKFLKQLNTKLIKQRKEENILGSLRANSLFPNNFIDNAINQ